VRATQKAGRVVKGDPLEPEELEGAFARYQNVDKVLLGWSDGSLTALIYALLSEGNEIPLQVAVTTAPFPDGTALSKMLDAWQPPSEAVPLTVRAMRGVPVGKMLAESRRITRENFKESELFGFVPTISFSSEDGTRIGFKNLTQFANAVRQVRAAVLYEYAVTEGRSDPAILVAERMCEGDVRKAKNLIVAARRNGYLTSGQKASGRVQGQLTPEGKHLIDLLLKEAEYERSQT
jgi:hypothetical protein